MDSSNTVDIIQNHYGAGDNVGTKYYQAFQTLTPQHLVKPVGMVFSSIRDKDNAKALIQLEIIQSTENLDDRARSILKILSIHLGLGDSASADNYPALINFLSSASSDLEFDICLAALLRLDLKNGKTADAAERYKLAEKIGEYSKEIFYELIADSDTLETEFNQKKLLMKEGEFSGIILGAIRVENHQLLSLATTRLSETFPSYNSHAYSLICETLKINPELSENQSYFISRTTKEKIDKILLQTEKLISESRGKDPRLFDIAVSLLQYTGWSYPSVTDTCWAYVSEFEKKYPEYATRLHIAYNEDFSNAPDVLKKIGQAKSNSYNRQEIAKTIINNQSIDSDTFPLLFETLTPAEMRQWLRAGGKFSINDNFERSFIELLLYSSAITSKEEKLAIEELRVRCKEFVDLHIDLIKKINQHLLLRLCTNLDKLKLPSICCAILKPLLPAKDLWVSPVLTIYLKSLLDSHQLITLESILSDLHPDEWNATVWQIKAMAHEQAGDLHGSLKAAEQMSALAHGDLAATSYYAHLVKKSGATDLEVSEIFKSIPDSSLAYFSNEAVRAVLLIANFQSFQRAEKILLNWFTHNPSSCATAITHFHFNLIERENLVTSPKLEQYIGGFKYSKEGEEFTKLAVKNKPNDNDFVLDSDSPLAKLLATMNIGETTTHNMQDVTLLEKLDPYTTIFRLALKIRDLNNDGSDVFSVLHVPEDPEDLVEVLKRKLGENRVQQEERHNIVADATLPIFFKGHNLNGGNSIKAALEQLTNRSSSKLNLPNFGIQNPGTALIDPYTACYLGLTGLAYSITNHPTKFQITAETRAAIHNWLSEVRSPSYMTIGTNEHGQLIRTTGEDIAKQFKQLMDGLQIILDSTDTVYPRLYNLPEQLIQFEHFFDIATFSTIKSSLANNTPWLCMDETFAYLLNSLNYPLMPAYSSFTEMGSDLDYTQKSPGLLLHAINSIPYALTFRDLLLLTTEENANADYALAEILKSNKPFLAENTNSTETITRYLSILIFKGYKQKHLDDINWNHDPSKSKYFEKAFNACLEIIISSSPELKAEHKIAYFFYNFTKTYVMLKATHEFVANQISKFCNGHFLSIESINLHLEALRGS